MPGTVCGYGVPNIVHPDGNLQSESAEIKAFAKTWEFKHSMSSLYRAQSRGKQEAAVKITKNLLKKAKEPMRALHPVSTAVRYSV